MLVLLLVAALCAGWPGALCQVQVPCYGEGCVNITVYLGPRWGSKVVIAPRTPAVKYVPQHRPIPEDGRFQVDVTDDETPSGNVLPSKVPFHTTKYPYNLVRPWRESTTRRPLDNRVMDDDRSEVLPHTTNYPYNLVRSWRGSSTTRRPSDYRANLTNSSDEVRVVVSAYGRGMVDLSWRGFTGGDVKRVLMTLSEPDRSKVYSLNLAGNRIKGLPVMAFPAEFEYGLQELSLANNFFPDRQFSSYWFDFYTRFELSRLARLRTLNMSNCGIPFFNTPYLPSLEVLDLSNNRLSVLPPNLDRLGCLRELYLGGNSITYIAESQLSSLRSLSLLDLSDNTLREIQGEPLINLPDLRTIKLDNNHLRSLPQLGDGEIKIVSIRNNPLQCSCNLMRDIMRQGLELHFDQSCQDDNNRAITSRGMLAEAYRDQCSRNSIRSEFGWGSRAERSVASWWYGLNLEKISFVILQVLGLIVAFGVFLALLVKSMKRKGVSKPQNIPYSALDEQPVSTVSGPHVDV